MTLNHTLCESDFYSGDPLSEYGLPGFHAGRENPVYDVVRTSQVFRRLLKLGLGYHDISDILSGLFEVYSSVNTIAETRRIESTSFRGTKVSELNRRLSDGGDLVVWEKGILFDEPLHIDGSARVDFRGVNTAFDPSFAGSHAVVVRDARNVILKKLRLDGSPCSGIIVLRSKDVCVTDCALTSTNGCPLTVLGKSERVLLYRNRIEGFGFAGIHIQGAVSRCVVEDNVVSGGTGTYNGHPGLFIGDRERNLPKKDDFSGKKPWPLYRYVSERVEERLHGPRENLIVSNTFTGNRGAGIYSDGAMLNYYAYNTVEHNGKEGACFDFGSTGNMFFRNTVTGNGNRTGHSDRDLKGDYVLDFGRMADGTARAKVPGISLDNALHNILLGNTVCGNYGGGIKCVRSGFYNVICDNLIEDNNRGENDIFHFFGIELGAAPAENDWDESDICPSVGNIVIHNDIRGNHYSGIFLGEQCVQNEVHKNKIIGASSYALESVCEQENYISRNVSNVPSVNIAKRNGKLLAIVISIRRRICRSVIRILGLKL